MVGGISDSIPEASPSSDDGKTEADEDLAEVENGTCHVKEFNLWYKGDNGQDVQLSKDGTEENQFDKIRIYPSPDGKI